MKKRLPEKFRYTPKWISDQFFSTEGDRFGIFAVKHRGRYFKCIVTDGIEYREEDQLDTGWEHVSVSCTSDPTFTPTWETMCHIKNLFWDKDECVVQYHPVESDYVNNHPGCLHLWKSTKVEMPTPDKAFV